MRRLLLLGCTAGVLTVGGPDSGPGAWTVLEPGLELAEFPAPHPTEVGDSRIRVLRIDPARFDLVLLNASNRDGLKRSARDWCSEFDLVAAVNASMYQEDHRTSVSLMRTRDHVNNSFVSKDKAVLAFDPDAGVAPPVRIIDRECDDLDEIGPGYGTLVQSIRMVSCRRSNVWSPQARRHSTAAVGIDEDGRVLFIHVRSPYSTHDLIEMLLALPLGLTRCMYTEGGPQAQMAVRGGPPGRTGAPEGGFLTDEAEFPAWPVPNVIGVTRRPRE